jgi:hypothetical protein
MAPQPIVYEEQKRYEYSFAELAFARGTLHYKERPKRQGNSNILHGEERIKNNSFTSTGMTS